MAKISNDCKFHKMVNNLDGDSRPINRNGKAARATVMTRQQNLRVKPHIKIMKQPKEIKFSNVETGFIDTEIKTLLEKRVVVPSCHESGEFVSTIFVRPKPDGPHRLILTLKRFNEHVVYHHFKMESLKSALQMMKPGCYNYGFSGPKRCILLSSCRYKIPKIPKLLLAM